MRRRGISQRPRALRNSGRFDDGFTLVEVVITVALMALVIVPVMIATITLIRASSIAGSSAETQRAISDAADRVTRADTGCDYSSAISASVVSRGWPASAATATYQYYTGSGTATANGSWSPPGTSVSNACPGGLRQPRLIQLVTITITNPSGDKQRIQVVKSDV
ncbi:MAG TPA: prepilin-type N-terminal cleavage/methylation domain-containing protein [Ilumatobacteraceae bacterium]|nr:prepilin-type N-terminal cleavage/methylation domain-containing protein [Ilumatobacteraceae bacterium]